ncbi:MAG: TolC family protein [Paucimonas sp.]|jgi:outer membrane protein|uniref:TolC family protein n=1 Tax=Pantoea sp. Cy-639 TaxID=2608360 RepID=UPI00142023C2|nr:TolC family protein [Pantoea sp. Cy-639]MDR2306037.1 TolC family protein [Paucimonas sp.]NIF16085.1 TolC family protein [Pantoea sp. Cy-639]
MSTGRWLLGVLVLVGLPVLAATDIEACPGPLRPGEALGLSRAVAMALCADPQIEAAWRTQLSSQASMEAERSAYWPTLQGTASSGRANRKTRYDGFPEANSSLDARTSSYGLNLNWVLYDFGLRKARVESARQLLNAASSSRVEQIQQVVLDTSKAFYQVQANTALLEARRSIEALAADSLKVTTAKHQAGAGEQADRLQAQTTFEQAQLERVLAEGDLAAAQGALASALHLSPSLPLRLEALDEPQGQEAAFSASVDALMAQARLNHPSVEKARAEWSSSLARADAERAQGRPTVSLYSSYRHDDTPVEQVASRQQIETWTVGVQVSVPIFDGFLARRRTRAAEYEAGAREQDLQQAERSIALSVWRSRQTLDARTRALAISRRLVDSASQSHRVAMGRYKAGVGGIIELLNAQNDLATAQQRRVSSVVDWYTARLQLAADLGQLGQ